MTSFYSRYRFSFSRLVSTFNIIKINLQRMYFYNVITVKKDKKGKYFTNLTIFVKTQKRKIKTHICINSPLSLLYDNSISFLSNCPFPSIYLPLFILPRFQFFSFTHSLLNLILHSICFALYFLFHQLFIAIKKKLKEVRPRLVRENFQLYQKFRI